MYECFSFAWGVNALEVSNGHTKFENDSYLVILDGFVIFGITITQTLLFWNLARMYRASTDHLVSYMKNFAKNQDLATLR